MSSQTDEELTDELRGVIEQFDCVTGTLHRATDDGLELVAHQNVPGPVLERVETVPIGKGMAGLAAERREPVQVCNLQTDDSGVAEEGARETGAEGSIAAPIFDDDALAGVLGVAKAASYEFSDDEVEALQAAGSEIAVKF